VASSNNVCPAGWHVPSDAEWTALTTFLGGEAVAGGNMKSAGTQYFLNQNVAGNKSSGFSGLPGGARNVSGTFIDIGYGGYLWSSVGFAASSAELRSLENGSVVGQGSYDKRYGFTVRCLRD